MFLLVDVLIACVLDLIIGDPKWLPHPVNFIGFLIKRLEKVLLDVFGKRFYVSVKTFSNISKVRSERGKRFEIFAGFILMLLVVSIVSGIIAGILYLASLLSMKYLHNNILFHILNTYFIYTSLAAKSLSVEVEKVFKALDERDIFSARKNLSYLVSRETENLSEAEIIKSAVETTAENTVDGVVSPLFYAIIGCFFGVSAPLVYAFKSISTLDSMVGYMNERYIYFGFASAKTDDGANYIPARITGLMVVVAAFFSKFDYVNSLKVLLRDRHNHKSPNCAYPEAAFAGALNVTLGGPSVYFGKVVDKPIIGDEGKEVVKNDIMSATRLMFFTYMIGVFSFFSFASIVMLIIFVSFSKY